MVVHGRLRIEDNPHLPSANRKEDLKKIVDVGLTDEGFQITNVKTGRSAAVSSILKIGR